MNDFLIDSHCHLNFDYSPKTIEQLIQEAKDQKISHLINVGVEIEKAPELEAISSQYENIYHTVGLHPHDAIQWNESSSARIKQFAQHPRCRAIGEIGLDYYYNHSDPETQKRVLQYQLDLALELKLPIVVHSRDGEADLLPALTQYAKQVPSHQPVGVIHCFTGTQAFGEACLALGFFISFSGILTFKNADDLRKCAVAFPLEKLLVETDSPYLAPIPFRGKKCEPSMVVETAKKLAELKGVPFEKVAQITSQNSKQLFSIV